MSKVNNYLVTFSEVSTMGFTAKTSWPAGSGSYAMNRGEVDTYWYVRQDVSPYSGYTNKRYPRYQDLQATTTTSTTTTTTSTTTTTTTTTAAPQCTYDGLIIVCDVITTTSTTTSTTTTTTASPGYYYNVDTFGCFPCYATPFTNLIAYSPVAIVNNLYYNNGDGNVYYVNYTYASPQASFDIDLTGAAGQIDCASACSI
jgi:hypothetical protein